MCIAFGPPPPLFVQRHANGALVAGPRLVRAPALHHPPLLAPREPALEGRGVGEAVDGGIGGACGNIGVLVGELVGSKEDTASTH